MSGTSAVDVLSPPALMADSPPPPETSKRPALDQGDATPRHPPAPTAMVEHDETQRKTPIAHLSLRNALVPFRPALDSTSSPGIAIELDTPGTSTAPPAQQRVLERDVDAVPGLSELVLQATLEGREQRCPQCGTSQSRRARELPETAPENMEVCSRRGPQGTGEALLPGSMPEARPGPSSAPIQDGEQLRVISQRQVSPIPFPHEQFQDLPPRSPPPPDASPRNIPLGTQQIAPQPFTSERLSARMKNVEQNMSKKLTKLTQQWLGALASQLRLQEFKDKGEVPNTLRIRLPKPRIQALGLNLELEQATLANGDALSVSIRDNVIDTAQTKVAELKQEIDSIMPNLESVHDQEHWVQKVILFENDESPLLQNLPAVNPLGARLVSKFTHLLDEGFANFCLAMRTTVQSTFNRIVNKNKVLSRHFCPDEVIPDAAGDPVVPSPEDMAVQIESLRQQVASLSTHSRSTQQRTRRGRQQKPQRQQNRRRSRSQSRGRTRNRQRPNSRGRSPSRQRSSTPHPRRTSKNGRRGGRGGRKQGRQVHFVPQSANQTTNRRRSRSTSRNSRRTNRGRRNRPR